MRRVVGIIIVIVLLIGIGLGVYLSLQKQDIRQHASEETSPTMFAGDAIAIVGATVITNAQVLTSAREQYALEAITPEAKKIILDSLIERAILDQEAEKNQITITEEELLQVPNGQTKVGRYEILKKKILGRLTESREAFVIGYWVPPSDYSVSLTAEQQATIDAIRRDGKVALEEAEKRFSTEDALSIGRSLVEKYPSLKDTLGVNGYILARTPDESVLTLPRVYTKDPESQGQPLFDTLFSMNAGEIKIALADKDAGGSVIKMMKVNHAGYSTYDEFLAAKIKELVKLK